MCIVAEDKEEPLAPECPGKHKCKYMVPESESHKKWPAKQIPACRTSYGHSCRRAVRPMTLPMQSGRGNKGEWCVMGTVRRGGYESQEA